MRVYPSFIAGLPYEGRARFVAKHLRRGDRLTLRREPDNPFDEDAVAFYFGDRHVGYVPAKHDWISRSIDEGDTHTVVVRSVTTKGWFFKRAVKVAVLVGVED